MKSSFVFKTIFYLLLLSIALLNYAWHRYGGWWLPQELYKQRVELIGRIASLPQTSVLGTSFLFKLEYLNQQPVNTLIKLTGYLDQHLSSPLAAGDRWQFTSRLKPLHALHNFEGNDYSLYQTLQGIRASGYIIKQSDKVLLQHDRFYFPLLYLRQSIKQKILGLLPNLHEEAAILAALTVGATTEMSQSQWQVFRLTGTSHLVAISGLHIGLMASLGFFLFKLIGKVWPRVYLKIPAPHLGAIGSVLFALIYSALAGFAWPTQRALLMVLVMSLTTLFFRNMALWRCLALSLIIILVIEPWGILSASFWLSYCAVTSLCYGLGGRWHKLSDLKQSLRMQWIVFLLLLPISLYYFKQVSLVMLLANFVAIPCVAWLVVPLSLSACLFLFFSQSLAKLFLLAAAYLLKFLWVFLTYLSQWPVAAWHHSIPHLALLILVSLGAVLFAVPQGIPTRALGCVGLALLWFYHMPKPAKDEWWLTLLDVGQGLSVIVQTKNHLMIYDAGVRYPGAFDAGRDVILPFMDARGLTQVDLMVISHGDNDHSGGAASLVSSLNISKILSSVPYKFKYWSVEKCISGQSWEWDGVVFKILSPSPGDVYLGNNSSCVIKISSNAGSVLLTGDIQAPAERYLLAVATEELKSDVLIAPHHGSLTSSLEAFVRAVGAKTVLFATGFLNRYGFPHRKIVSLYQKYHAKMYSSARDGAVELRFKPDGHLILRTAITHEKHSKL